MPLLGYGSRLRNNSEVPSSYYFNLATWHTINQAYTKKACCSWPICCAMRPSRTSCNACKI
jgi:hypothetical protein